MMAKSADKRGNSSWSTRAGEVSTDDLNNKKRAQKKITELSIQSTMLLTKVLEGNDHIARFLTKAAEERVVFYMDKKSIDFIKNYIRENNLRREVPRSAASILPDIVEVAARTGPPNEVEVFPDDPFEMFNRTAVDPFPDDPFEL